MLGLIDAESRALEHRTGGGGLLAKHGKYDALSVLPCEGAEFLRRCRNPGKCATCIKVVPAEFLQEPAVAS